MRGLVRFAALALWLASLLPAATLQKLGLDEMAQKSTSVVRARVVDSYAEQRGSIVYTHYRLQVSEWWKGSGSNTGDLAVPGGVADGLRQTFPGAPQLAPGAEYVLFLWTGPRGRLTQIIGLSQGLFKVDSDSNGQLVATRAASGAAMLDPSTGRGMGDESASYHLNDLHTRVSAALTSGGAK